MSGNWDLPQGRAAQRTAGDGRIADMIMSGDAPGWTTSDVNGSANADRFTPNDKVSDGGPLTHELKQDANPPFASPLG